MYNELTRGIVAEIEALRQECDGWKAATARALNALAEVREAVGADGHCLIDELLAHCEALRRWKSTNAPRIEALQGLLTAAQHEAHAGREAIATLASEREANAILTTENERLRDAIARSCAGYPADDAAAPTCVAILRAALED